MGRSCQLSGFQRRLTTFPIFRIPQADGLAFADMKHLQKSRPDIAINARRLRSAETRANSTILEALEMAFRSSKLQNEPLPMDEEAASGLGRRIVTKINELIVTITSDRRADAGWKAEIEWRLREAERQLQVL